MESSSSSAARLKSLLCMAATPSYTCSTTIDHPRQIHSAPKPHHVIQLLPIETSSDTCNATRTAT